MLIPEASNSALTVDNTFSHIMEIEIVLLALVTFFIVLFIIKYNRRKNRVPVNIEGSLFLEIIWIVIPTILVLIMFYIGWRSFIFLRTVPKEALTVNVTARQWSWLFTYENGRQSDILRVPVGEPVKLVLTSRDVIHCLYIPAFRIKEDCVPGMKTYLWFTAEETGTYTIFCTEYCGLGHSGMLSKADVMMVSDFNEWYAGRERRPKKGSGLRILEEKGCLGCHTITGAKKIGPTLKGIFGHKVTVITDGKERTITIDEEYVRRSVLTPGADVVKGFPNIMPKLPVNSGELEEIVEYLKGLK